MVGRVVPLHRRAGARAEVAALLGGQRQIAHTDLVTVVDEGCTGQRENCRVGQPQLVSRQARGGADRVMVAGDEAPQTVLVGGLVGRQVIVQEFVNAGAGVLAEVRLADVVRVRVHRTVIVAHEPVVAVALPIEIKVHVKAVFQRHARAVPLGDERGLGVLDIQHIPDIAPDFAGVLFVLSVILYKARRHIDAETVAAHVQPEPHDVLHGLHRRHAGGIVGGLLPLLVDLSIAVVQRGLALEEVQDIRAVALGLAADERHPVAGGKAGIRPDKAVRVFVVPGLAAGLEPRVFLARVAGHQVEQHTDALLMRGPEQRGGVLVRAVARGDLFVVAHIIARILERRIKAGVDPQGIAAQVPDIVELGNNALQITDAVAVGIIEALGVDFIEHCVFQPLFHEMSPLL